MSDRYKYRVWFAPNWQKPEMIYEAEHTYDNRCRNKGSFHHESFGEILEDRNCTVMQSTGLKDKNGKLIYEGDIVNQIYEDETIYKCEVIYNNCSFQLKHIEDKNKDYINTPMYCYAINYLGHYTEKRLEIIGNIYENKDLLNENS